MTRQDVYTRLTRRDLLQLSTVGALVLEAELVFPNLALAVAARQGSADSHIGSDEEKLYSELLHTWCDGLVARQVMGLGDSALNGGFLCPACGLIHGRCGDAIYPLLRMANTSGDQKYLRAALAVHEWSERTVSRADGSWVNDVSLSTWQGITVFHTIALAEALEHHGSILDEATRRKWTDRLARAAKFLDSFITLETGNINYPVTSSLAFVLCGQVLADAHYVERGRKLAQQVMEQFTPGGFLFGEGHPLTGVTAKGCRPVDLGYNVEESLPSLALYALLANDKPVLDQTIASLRTHMEFMLPDGAWDNSWGTRNYKWSWWGSRTSDGCHPGYVLLAGNDPKFREAARRNVELMAACTHNGLLYGGPDYFAHDEPPCIHHTFTHAKALATVLDRASFSSGTGERSALPRDEPYGLKTFPEIGTWLAAVGPWRATVTEYDWEYAEHVQAGAGAGGDHVSGGALSMLFHRELGPVLTASMTAYQMIEIANQQTYREGLHMELTPRIECVSSGTYTSVNDLKAVVAAKQSSGEIVFDARGRLLTASRQSLSGGDIGYHMIYRLSETGVELVASVSSAGHAPARLILPVISRAGERVQQPDMRIVRIAKPGGTLTINTDAAAGFEPVPKERTFNLVPGFECIPLSVELEPGKETRIRIDAAVSV